MIKKLLIVLILILGIGTKLAYDFFPIKYYDEIVRVSKLENVDIHIILSMIKVESNYREKIVSPKGAVGLMQVMPATAEWILKKNGLNPKDYSLYNAEDIFIGTIYFKYLSEKFDGDLEKIMAAYNGGLVRVNNNTWKNIPETNKYVKKINLCLKVYQYKLPIYEKIRGIQWKE